MTSTTLFLAASLPGWLQAPSWLRLLTRDVGRLFFHDHQSFGLFFVIFAEELGIPLPAPGDAWIMYGGYLTTTGAIPYPMAYVAVVSGAVIGSFILYAISRRFGHPFLVRFGRYISLDARRLEKAERQFRRWGPWAIIIGRHIPGMRIVISAFAGAFEVPVRIFVPSVFVSALLWAAIFLELGRVLGRNSRLLLRLLPAHLLPGTLLVIGILAVVFLAYEHGWRPHRARREQAAAGIEKPEKAPSRP